ncbi:hypothetical protein SRHO_G00092190 [Serrasalmus rhombeus]
MSAPQSASSKSFTSTPLKSKSTIPRSIPRSKSLESTGDSTYSLLSPIYHDSFDFSDEDNEEAPKQYQPADNSSLTVHEDGLSVSPTRNETLESLHAQDASTGTLNLSAWEQWVVSKAKEERMKMQQKALEQEALKEKKAKEEKEQQRKKAVSVCKIQEWLQMKKEQEKQEKLCRESQKTKKMLYEEQKRLEIERKAQEKYKEWLRQKKQEEMVRKLKEQEEIARREKEERERKERAEEMFKDWLKNIKDKDRQCQSSACPAGGYDNLNYPSPTFVNPIPWKPIHIPQQNRTPRKNMPQKKQPGRDEKGVLNVPTPASSQLIRETEKLLTGLEVFCSARNQNLPKTLSRRCSGASGQATGNLAYKDSPQEPRKRMPMQIWDTAGQERFRTITQSYYRSAHGAMIAYDLTRRSTFDSLPHWIQAVEQYGAANVVFVLIGNKCDLAPQRQVLFEDACTLAEQTGALAALETSAKENRNVQEAFELMARELIVRNGCLVHQEVQLDPPNPLLYYDSHPIDEVESLKKKSCDC